MNQLKTQIFIFSALECEAKPLINHFGLKKDLNHSLFLIYRNESFILTVTGVGKVAMAGGVAYSLATYMDKPLPVLINIGIAGHKTKKIGTLCLAEKVVDVDAGKNFYPQLIGNKWAETHEIKTYSRPSSQYIANSLCDMEASAFFETALRFSTSELIHCIKVVSDNQNFSIDRIQAKLVAGWVAIHLDEIEGIIKDLIERRGFIPLIELEHYSDIEKKWHFTVSGKIKLRALLLRWEILSDDAWVYDEESIFKGSKDILLKLEADVARLKVFL